MICHPSSSTDDGVKAFRRPCNVTKDGVRETLRLKTEIKGFVFGFLMGTCGASILWWGISR